MNWDTAAIVDPETYGLLVEEYEMSMVDWDKCDEIVGLFVFVIVALSLIVR